MNEQRNNENQPAGRKPDYIAYNVRESQDGKGYWNKVGAAWKHRDGQGYDINLESIPVDGRVTLRELREERTQETADQTPSRALSQERNHGRSR